MAVRVLFRGDAALKLRKSRINVDEWSPIYHKIEGELRDRLRAAEFGDLEQFLQDAKEHGDDVRFWISEETLAAEGATIAEMAPFLDGALSEGSFQAIASRSTAHLSF